MYSKKRPANCNDEKTTVYKYRDKRLIVHSVAFYKKKLVPYAQDKYIFA